MNDITRMQLERMAERAAEHFPHDARIPILLRRATEGCERAWDTLYELSNGRTRPIK